MRPADATIHCHLACFDVARDAWLVDGLLARLPHSSASQSLHPADLPGQLVAETHNIKSTDPLVVFVMMKVADVALAAVEQLKLSERFQHIPIIVIAEEQPEINASDFYRRGVSSFVRRPATDDARGRFIDSLVSLWMVSTLPNSVYD